MKKITIGRHISNDIVIPDDEVLVSRKHAVITVSFFGKMRIYDTSTGGTTVNGLPVDKGMGAAVTRKDEVKMNTVALDWARVADPYRKWRLVILMLLLLCGIAAGVMAYMHTNDSSAKDDESADNADATEMPKTSEPEAAEGEKTVEATPEKSEAAAPADAAPEAKTPAPSAPKAAETKPKAPAAKPEAKESKPAAKESKPAAAKPETKKPAAKESKPAPQPEKKIEVESYD